MVGMGGGNNKYHRHYRNLLYMGTPRHIDRQDSQPHPHHRDMEATVPLSHQFPPFHLALLEKRYAHASMLCHSLRHVLGDISPPPHRAISRLPSMDGLLSDINVTLLCRLHRYSLHIHRWSKKYGKENNQKVNKSHHETIHYHSQPQQP